MEYLEKIDINPYQDLYWNIPETKKGKLNVIGGNLQGFKTPMKIAEYLNKNYPLEEVRLILPDVLQNKLPLLDNLIFVKSTDSGSIADKDKLSDIINFADFNVLIGDFSHNKITEKAVGSAVDSSEKPLLITRDTLDILAVEGIEGTFEKQNLVLFGSMMQLQKIFRSIYYPRMILLSQPLIQVAETLHKFTLSYQCTIITLHNGQLLIAKNGKVVTIPLEKTNYSPITIWSGELAAKISVLNLYNPNMLLEASIAAIFSA